jgi:glycogen operon protein
MPTFRTSRGRPLPLGASTAPESVNFALLCRHGESVTLVILPDGPGDPLLTHELDPRKNKTGDHWHVSVYGLPTTFCYGWKVTGPKGLQHRFNPSRLLLDPAAAMVSNGEQWAGTCEIDPGRTSRRSLYHRGPRYDWGEDHPPRIPMEDSIIYELHVRGFTCDPSSPVKNRGTFAGLAEAIPHLKDLGITAVELMPVFEWDECDCPFFDPDTGEKHSNFWGYNPIAFAAPKAALAASAKNHGQVAEFRDMVKAFHANDMEVILDVVFNHTGEGDDRGRTFSFRGLDNELYYLLDDRGRYLNYTGCGNTVNCNHPVVRDLIMTCLRYWVSDMHVDGFRFDLASILGRDRRGNVMVEPPVIESITEDGVLADAKLIAEPWDAAGLYQVGGFPFGRRWTEWNGHYRDDIRRFWRGDAGLTPIAASRICGSADLYQWNNRLPRHTVNFITCHDGFTLWDLVSFNQKHNEANGEGNRDGLDENFSWNCGAEGETTDPDVMMLRWRQCRNLMATLLLSQGVPMILGGDEFLRTQRGNNNAWCQDNEISWVNWEFARQNADFLRFTKEMIALRKRHPVLRRRKFFKGEIRPGSVEWQEAGLGLSHDTAGLDGSPLIVETGEHSPAASAEPAWSALPPFAADIHWHGAEPYKPDFGHYSRVLAFSLDGRFPGQDVGTGLQPRDNDLYVAMNAWHGPLKFRIPPSPQRKPWRRVVDTAKPAPEDFLAEGHGPVIAEGSLYTVEPYSLIVLVSE